MHFRKICDGLYIRGDMRHHPVEKRLDALAARNIKVVVNLWKPDDELAERLGVNYVCLPIADGPTAKKHFVELAALAFTIAEYVRAGHGVLVHCRAGRNRSAFVAALAYRYIIGCSGASALEHVRKRRKGAIANDTFEEHLMSLGPRD